MRTKAIHGPNPLALVFLWWLFFVSSFRRFRSRLHDGIKDEELKKFLKHPGPAHWKIGTSVIFGVAFGIVDLAFAWQFAQKLSLASCTSIVGGGVLIAVLIAIWRLGQSEEEQLSNDQKTEKS